VYYMPANPEECLLEPGIKAQSWFLPGFGLVFFVVGSLMAVFIPRAVKKQAPTKQEHRFYDD
jgi:type IV secretory pathway TrbD component